MALGGWLSLILIAVVGALACATGLQISDGFEMTNSQTYYAFAFAAGGTVAEKFTLGILTFYFISSNVFNSLIIMDTLYSTFLYFDIVDEGTQYAISISIIVVIPLILIAFNILLPRGLTMIGELHTPWPSKVMFGIDLLFFVHLSHLSTNHKMRIGEVGTAFVVLLLVCLFASFFQIIHKNNTDPGWDGEVPVSSLLCCF